MLVDDSLRLQFRRTKTSLFGALLDRHRPTLDHVLSAPPSLRDAMRTEADDLISSLLEVECELEAFQQEAKRVRESVTTTRCCGNVFSAHWDAPIRSDSRDCFTQS